jgi:hypothetical protein
MSKRASRALRGPISVLLFAALAAAGVPFGYYAALSGFSSRPAQVAVEHEPAPLVVAGVDSAR